jgi:hypothetical protein
MAAVNFPNSPSNGDTFTSGNSVYTYNSTKTRWDAVTTVNGIQLNSLSVGSEGTASGDGAIVYNNSSGEFSYTPPDLSTLTNLALTGVPTSPTAATSVNNTQIASTAYVTTAVAAGSSTSIIKTYNYSGTLATSTGSLRFYSSGSYTLSSADIHMHTAAAGSSVNITINKNGSSAATLTFAAGATSSLSNSLSVSLVQGDYLTIDITQVGSTTAGADLYLLLKLT